MPEQFEAADIRVVMRGEAGPLRGEFEAIQAEAKRTAKEISAAFSTVGFKDFEGKVEQVNNSLRTIKEAFNQGYIGESQFFGAMSAGQAKLSNLQAEIDGTARKTRELAEIQSQLGGAFRTLGVSDLEGQFRKANDAFNVFSTGFGKGIVSQRQYSEATRNFNQIFQQYQRELDGTNPKMRAWIASQEEAAQKQRQLGAATLHSAYILRQQATSLTHLGTLTAAAFAPAAAGIGIGVKAFLDFDNAMKTSLAIAGDVSDEMKGRLAQSAKDLSKVLTGTATQNAAAFYSLFSAGMSAEEALKGLPIAAKFAQAGNMDLAKATELLAQAQMSLGLHIKGDAIANMQEMARVSDVLNRANEMATGTTEEFAKAVAGKAGVAARQFHIPLEQLVAVLIAFHQQSVKATQAGTYFDIFLREITTKSVKDAHGAFKQLGITIFDSAGKLLPLGNVISSLSKALQGMSPELQTNTLLQLGFTQRSLFAVRALLGLGDAVKGYTKDLELAAGTTDKISNNQLLSFEKQIQLIHNRLNVLSIELGQSFAPALEFLGRAVIGPLISKLEDLARKFQELPKPAQDMAASIALSTTASGVATSALLLFGGQVLRLAADLKYLGLSASAAFGTIGLAVAAIATLTLGTAFVVANADAKTLAATVSTLVDTFGPLGKVAGAVLIAIETAIKHATEPLERFIELLKEIADHGMPTPSKAPPAGKPGKTADRSGVGPQFVDPAAWKEFLDIQARVREFEEKPPPPPPFDPEAASKAKAAAKDLATLTKALRELGIAESEVSAAQLDKDLELVHQAFLKNKVSAETYAKALENIQQIKIERRDKDLGITSIEQLNLNLAKAKETLDKVTTAYANNQASAADVVLASEKVDKIQQDINKSAMPLVTIWADQALAIGRLASGFGNYGNSLDLIKQKIDNETLEALDKLNGDLDLTYNKVSKLSEANFGKSIFPFLPGVAGDLAKLDQIFAGDKLKTTLGLSQIAEESKRNYQTLLGIYNSLPPTIRESVVSVFDLYEQWIKWVEDTARAQHRLPDEIAPDYRRIKNIITDPVRESQKIWNDFMRDIKRLGRQFASEAFDILWPKQQPKQLLDTSAITSLSNATGLVGEELQGLANQIDDLAQATGGNFSSTVDKVTAQFRIWSVATDQQAKELEYLYKASNLTKTGLDALTSITAEQATALKALGFDYEHAVALIGSLNSQNVDSAKVIDNLTKAYQELEQKGYRDPGAALAQLINSIKTARSETDANAIATRHFGDAGVFMARTIRSGKLDVDKLTTAINQSAASMHDAAEETRRLNAEGGKVSKLTQLFRDLTREIAKMAAGQLAKGIADILHLEAAWRKVGKAIGGALEALLRWIGLSKKAKDTSSAVEEGVSAIDEARKRSLDAAEKIPSVSKPPTSGGGPGLGTPPSGPGGSAGGAAGGATGWMGVVNMVTGAISAVTGVLSYLQGRRMEQDIGRIEVTTRGLLNEALNSRRDAWDQYNGMYKRLGEVWNSIKALNMGPTQPQTIGDTSYTSGFEVDQIGLMRLLVSKFDQFVIPKMDAIVALMKSMPTAAAEAAVRPATEGLIAGQVATQSVAPLEPRASAAETVTAPTESSPLDDARAKGKAIADSIAEKLAARFPPNSEMFRRLLAEFGAAQSKALLGSLNPIAAATGKGVADEIQKILSNAPSDKPTPEAKSPLEDAKAKGKAIADSIAEKLSTRFQPSSDMFKHLLTGFGVAQGKALLTSLNPIATATGKGIVEEIGRILSGGLPDISPQPVLATAGASNMTTAHNQTLNFYYNDRSVDTPPETVYHAKMIAKTLSNRGVRRRIRK